jgi:bifunctional DNase/RNase
MLIRVTVERVTLDTTTSRFVVILKEENRNRWLPIVVGNSEAQAIALQLEKISPPRPLIHDLIRNLLETLDARVERIVVNDLRDNTYFALLGLRLNGEFRNIDARPSDAIALALRTEAPIFVDGNVMLMASISESDIEVESNPAEERDEYAAPEDILEQLSVDLMRAVQDERYEEAAKIRDEISKIKSTLRHNVS